MDEYKVPTIEEYKEVFPEFASVPDAVVQFYLDVFASTYCPTIFKSLWYYACYLWISHNLYLRSLQVQENEDGSFSPTDNAGITGTISSRSQKIGDVSDAVGYSTNTNSSDDWLNDTKYGKEFLSLIKKCIIGATSIYSSTQTDLMADTSVFAPSYGGINPVLDIAKKYKLI